MTLSTLEGLTTVLVIITGFYAWATFRILRANENVVREMQRQMEEFSRPRISIYIHTLPSRPMLYLTVENAGRSSASRLRLRLDRPFISEIRDTDISATAAFSKEIPSFGAGERMDIQLGRTFVILGEDKDEVRRPLEFSVTADYNFGSTKYSETTKFDLNIHRVRALTTDAMVEQISYLQERLKDIRNELRGIGVAIAQRSDATVSEE